MIAVMTSCRLSFYWESWHQRLIIGMNITAKLPRSSKFCFQVIFAPSDRPIIALHEK